MAARATSPLEERLALEPGQPYRMVLGDETRPDAAMAVRQVLRDGPNWHMPEDWGVWTKGGAATLRLPVPPGPAASWRLYLELVAPPGGGEVRLRAEAWRGLRVAEVLASPVDQAVDRCWPWGDPQIGPQLRTEWTDAIAEALTQPGLTMAVAPLRRLAEPGGVLDALAAQGFEVDGPEWRAVSSATHEGG